MIRVCRHTRHRARVADPVLPTVGWSRRRTSSTCLRRIVSRRNPQSPTQVVASRTSGRETQCQAGQGWADGNSGANGHVIAEFIAFLMIPWPSCKVRVPGDTPARWARQALIAKRSKDAEAARGGDGMAEAPAAYPSGLNEGRHRRPVKIRENARRPRRRGVRSKAAYSRPRGVSSHIARGEEQLAHHARLIVRELRGEIGSLAASLRRRSSNERLADAPGAARDGHCSRPSSRRPRSSR